MTDNNSTHDGIASNKYRQKLNSMLSGGGCAEAWKAANELRSSSNDELRINRRDVLRGAASGSAAIVPFATVGLSDPDEQFELPEAVNARLSEYAGSMEAVRAEFAHHAGDTLSELSNRGIIQESEPTAIEQLAVDGDPLASDTPVHIDVLGVRPDSYFDELTTVLTAAHSIDGMHLDVIVLPEQGDSLAYFNVDALDPDGFVRASTTGCEGEPDYIYYECGSNKCTDCSGWPFATFKTYRYYILEYNEPDGKCTESYRDTCYCDYSCGWF